MTRFILRLVFTLTVGILIFATPTLEPVWFHDAFGQYSIDAQERVTLSAPEVVPNNLTYRVERMTLQNDDTNTGSVDEGMISIQLMGVERATAVTCVYNATSSPTGTFLLTALNKANLSTAYAGNATTGSLVQRVFHRLIVMGESTAVCGRTLTGTLTGSPQ
jgi:hypothetical protein